MKISLCIAALFLLAGCDGHQHPPLTNDEIIAETKKCEDADMRAVYFSSMVDGTTRRIECGPREER